MADIRTVQPASSQTRDGIETYANQLWDDNDRDDNVTAEQPRRFATMLKLSLPFTNAEMTGQAEKFPIVSLGENSVFFGDITDIILDYSEVFSASTNAGNNFQTTNETPTINDDLTYRLRYQPSSPSEANNYGVLKISGHDLKDGLKTHTVGDNSGSADLTLMNNSAVRNFRIAQQADGEWLVDNQGIAGTLTLESGTKQIRTWELMDMPSDQDFDTASVGDILTKAANGYTLSSAAKVRGISVKVLWAQVDKGANPPATPSSTGGYNVATKNIIGLDAPWGLTSLRPSADKDTYFAFATIDLLQVGAAQISYSAAYRADARDGADSTVAGPRGRDADQLKRVWRAADSTPLAPTGITVRDGVVNVGTSGWSVNPVQPTGTQGLYFSTNYISGENDDAFVFNSWTDPVDIRGPAGASSMAASVTLGSLKDILTNVIKEESAPSFRNVYSTSTITIGGSINTGALSDRDTGIDLTGDNTGTNTLELRLSTSNTGDPTVSTVYATTTWDAILALPSFRGDQTLSSVFASTSNYIGANVGGRSVLIFRIGTNNVGYYVSSGANFYLCLRESLGNVTTTSLRDLPTTDSTESTDALDEADYIWTERANGNIEKIMKSDAGLGGNGGSSLDAAGLLGLIDNTVGDVDAAVSSADSDKISLTSSDNLPTTVVNRTNRSDVTAVAAWVGNINRFPIPTGTGSRNAIVSGIFVTIPDTIGSDGQFITLQNRHQSFKVIQSGRSGNPLFGVLLDNGEMILKKIAGQWTVFSQSLGSLPAAIPFIASSVTNETITTAELGQVIAVNSEAAVRTRTLPADAPVGWWCIVQKDGGDNNYVRMQVSTGHHIVARGGGYIINANQDYIDLHFNGDAMLVFRVNTLDNSDTSKEDQGWWQTYPLRYQLTEVPFNGTTGHVLTKTSTGRVWSPPQIPAWSARTYLTGETVRTGAGSSMQVWICHTGFNSTSAPTTASHNGWLELT